MHAKVFEDETYWYLKLSLKWTKHKGLWKGKQIDGWIKHVNYGIQVIGTVMGFLL